MRASLKDKSDSAFNLEMHKKKKYAVHLFSTDQE